MHKVVIADTSVFILLQNTGRIDLLEKVYQKIVTTPEVSEEFSESLPEWVVIREVADKKYQKSLETQVDAGEASVIALAKESIDPLLLLDDLKGRKLAKKLNLKISGTLGVIHKAKQEGIIPKVSPLLRSLIDHGFRISSGLLEAFLALNDEDSFQEK
jgi:predicted nucleic acid-binding protein